MENGLTRLTMLTACLDATCGTVVDAATAYRITFTYENYNWRDGCVLLNVPDAYPTYSVPGLKAFTWFWGARVFRISSTCLPGRAGLVRCPARPFSALGAGRVRVPYAICTFYSRLPTSPDYGRNSVGENAFWRRPAIYLTRACHRPLFFFYLPAATSAFAYDFLWLIRWCAAFYATLPFCHDATELCLTGDLLPRYI